MEHIRLGYTTGDRSLKMDFVFWDCGSTGWRIYIINTVDYKGRDTSFHATHRLHADGETYKYICWAGKISTLEEAKIVASLWADTTAIYVKSHDSFDKIAERLLKE